MPPFGSPEVLILDPDDGDSQAAAEALEASETPGPEATVTTVGRFDEAQAAIEETDFDCVVTEYDLPEASGLEVVEWVRDNTPDAACILCTDTRPDDIRTAAYETMIVEYLPKEMPDSALALSRLVGNIAGQHGQIAYPLPDNEDERLAAIEKYDVEGLDAEEAIDRITDLIASHFDIAVAFAGVVDAHEERFLACHGADWETLDREDTICTHIILEDDYMVVENVQADPRFSAAKVLEDLEIRSYAGVPLTTPDGLPIGALCLIHDEPRSYTDAEIETLQSFADELMEQLELRRRLRDERATTEVK